MAGSVQENTGKEDMSAPLNGPEASAALLNRHFTRAGRDPLALAPFEERLLLGRVIRLPSSWGPGGLIKLAKAVNSQPSSAYLVQVAREHAEAAHEAGFLNVEEHLTLVDELAWVLGRGMGWVGQDSGVWVGTVNLHHFCEPVTQRFDLAGLRQTCRCLLIAAAGRAAQEGRPHAHSLTWTNGAGFLVVSGIAYDSSRGVGILGSIAAMILGQSCLTLADLAARKPDLANPAAKQVVLGGLNNAKTRAADLPPTASVASPADSDRWQAQTQELLEEAIKAIESKGTISPYPTSPQPCPENEEWLDPISTFAEAVPTLQQPDLASRPEIRSSLKAMGLNEQQRGAVLSALSSGESILAAGVPEAKAPSLKTALGAWSFHPNAQLMMGSAAAPFVAGSLKHRIHLPSGIPEDFVASVKGAASRFGLTGAEPFIQEAGGGALSVPSAAASGGKEEAPSAEAPLPAEPKQEEPQQSAPEPEPETAPSVDADREGEASTALTPEVQQKSAEEPIPVEEASPVPQPAEPDSSHEPASQLAEEVEEPEALDAAPVQESTGETEPSPLQAEAAPDQSEPMEEGEVPAPQNEPTPLPVESEVSSEALPVLSEESEAAEVVNGEATEPEQVEAQADPTPLVQDEPLTEEAAVEGAAEAETQPTDLVEEVVGAEAPALDAIEGEAAPESGPDLEEPEADPTHLREEVELEPAAEAAPEPPAAPRLTLSEFDEPRVTLTPCAWSRSLKVASSSGAFTVHAAREDSNSPLFIGVTASSLPPLSRALLDASLAAINLGLSKGITIEEYRRTITEPSLMRDILAAVSKLVEEQ